MRPRGLEAARSRSRMAKINFGFMSMIVYDGGPRPKLISGVQLRGFEPLRPRGLVDELSF